MEFKYKSLANSIMLKNDFLEDFKILFEAYILKLVGDEFNEPSLDIAKRLSKASQIFVASKEPDKIEVGVKIIDMFLEISPSYLEDIIVIAEIIFSKIGAFPNLKLIETKWSNRKKLSKSLDYALEEEMHKCINNIEKLGVDATNFQFDLWNNLIDERDIVTIAPTSTGKSYIIMQYIIESMIEASDKTYAVYIVPSRALILEVSKTIQNSLNAKGIEDIEVATVGQRDKEYDKKTIFVLTQERLLMLLHFQRFMQFSYIVIDEAQHIAEGSRGVLLHIVLSNVITRGTVQLIFCSPSIEYQNTFKSLLGDRGTILQTEHSPVSKNYIMVKCEKRNLVMRSCNPNVEIEIPKKFTGNEYYKIVERLGNKSINLVYSNTKSNCETMVEKLYKCKADKNELFNYSDYIKKTVHDNYMLSDSILKGIVFHYGPLPRNIRVMIERLVEEKLIDYTVCTSTLAEGVNMPAKNLFIKDPKYSQRGAPSKPISNVKFKNIIGRAGRLMTHFSGNVFLIDCDKWEFDHYLKEPTQEPKLPTYLKTIEENTNSLILTMQGKELEENIDKDILNTTINKLLLDLEKGILEENLNAFVAHDKRNIIKKALDDFVQALELPFSILQLNPSIGIPQQHSLYNYLVNIEDINELLPIFPGNRSFPEYLYKILKIMYNHDLISIPSHIKEEKIDQYLHVIKRKTCDWVREKTLKEIITRDVNSKKRKINVIVRDTINFIDNTLRFRLSNSIKCFCDIYMYVAVQHGIDPDNIVEIYSFIEIGACNSDTISLISLGLSRHTAIEVKRLMKRDIDFESSNILEQIVENDNYNQLHIVTRKEIESFL